MNPLFNRMISFFALYEGDGAGAGGGAAKTDDEKLEEKVLRMVNAAVTSQLSRKLESSVTAAVTAAITPVLDQLKTPPAGKPKENPQADPAVAELQAQVAALTNQISEKDSTAAASTKKHREEQLVAEIREGLSKAGVKPELLDGAALTLRAKMTIDEKTGKASYRKQHSGWHEDLDPQAGLKDWTGTDTGKAHMAPVAGGGAGTVTPGAGSGRALNPATLPQDPAQRAKVIKAHKIANARKSLRENAVAMVGGGRIQLGGSADPAPE